MKELIMEEVQRDLDLNTVSEGIEAFARVLKIDETDLLNSLLEGLSANNIDLEEDEIIQEFITELKNDF